MKKKKAADKTQTYVPGVVMGITGIVFSLLFPGVTYGCSVPGLVLSAKRSKEERTVCAVVLNIVALVLALINSAIAIIITVRGFFKKHTGQF